MHNCPFEIINSIVAVGSWRGRREIAEQSTGKGVPCTSRINNLLQRIGWSTEIGSISTKEESTIASLLHYYKLQSHIQQLTHTHYNACLIRILPYLLLTHQEDINPLDDLGQLWTFGHNPELHSIQYGEACMWNLL